MGSRDFARVRLLHFSLRGPGLLASASADHPTCRLAVWCTPRRDIVEIRGPTPGAVRRTRAQIRRGAGPSFEILGEEDLMSRVGFDCPTDFTKNPEAILSAHRALSLHPKVYEAGWKRHRAIALDDSKVPVLFRQLSTLGDLRVDLTRPVSNASLADLVVLSPQELLGGLTSKQERAVLLALEHGHYRYPRAASLMEIARRSGAGRATFNEHLRKAEAKILTALAPILALRARPSPLAPPLNRKKRDERAR